MFPPRLDVECVTPSTTKLIERCAPDVRRLLLEDSDPSDDTGEDSGVVQLWDDKRGSLAAGQNYGEAPW